MKKNVALIYGGNSSEWEISILSGKNVASCIDRTLYNVYEIFLRGTSWGLCDPSYDKPRVIAEVDKTDFSVTVGGVKTKFDIAYLMIHGDPGENGLLQGYFEMMGIPHTTCSSFVSGLTFNKYACKSFLRGTGIHMAKDIYLKKGDPWDASSIVENLGLPLFVKPVGEGSSFGVTKVKSSGEIAAAIDLAFSKGDALIIEEAISGRELTQGVFLCGGKPVALPVTEIVTSREYFDYEAKYLGESQEICPAPISSPIFERMSEVSLKIYRHFGCNGVVRMDYILDGDEPCFLELNSVPGMTRMSLIPNQAREAGYRISDFINEILASAK